MSATLPAPQTLWDFSIASYGRDGVQPSVIALQDQHGADVNLLFFCCWLGAGGRGRLNTEEMRKLDAALDGWRRQVTVSLRAIRAEIKGNAELWALAGAAEVRARVLAAEIDSERVSHAVLEHLAPLANQIEDEDSGLQDALANLRTYFRLLEINPNEDDLENLLNLVRGSFPDGAESEIRESLQSW